MGKLNVIGCRKRNGERERKVGLGEKYKEQDKFAFKLLRVEHFLNCRQKNSNLNGMTLMIDNF